MTKVESIQLINFKQDTALRIGFEGQRFQEVTFYPCMDHRALATVLFTLAANIQTDHILNEMENKTGAGNEKTPAAKEPRTI